MRGPGQTLGLAGRDIPTSALFGVVLLGCDLRGKSFRLSLALSRLLVAKL